MSTDALKRALKRQAYLCRLEVNASYFLQPENAGLFGPLHPFSRRANETYIFDAVMAGNSTRGASLVAAYHSERRTTIPLVVTKAVKTTGLWPFSIPAILARAHGNLGVAPGGQTARDQARVMTAEGIAAVL